jgi:hypothetical protein
MHNHSENPSSLDNTDELLSKLEKDAVLITQVGEELESNRMLDKVSKANQAFLDRYFPESDFWFLSSIHTGNSPDSPSLDTVLEAMQYVAVVSDAMAERSSLSTMTEKRFVDDANKIASDLEKNKLTMEQIAYYAPLFAPPSLMGKSHLDWFIQDPRAKDVCDQIEK